MRSTVFALLAAIIMLIGPAAHITSNYMIFWDPVGVALVLGGTIIVAFITFPAQEVFALFKNALLLMRQPTDEGEAVAQEIILIAKETRGSANALQGVLTSVKNDFLRDSLNLIVDRIEPARIESIVRDRIKIKQETDETSSNMLKTLAKYPPSFGIIGTVLGLIAMLMQLGQGGTEKLGPAMAVGLVATLYGLLLTNFLIQPLAENLALRSVREVRRRQMVLLGVVLMCAGEQAVVVQEAVNSLLPEHRRSDVLGVGGSADTRGAA